MLLTKASKSSWTGLRFLSQSCSRHARLEISKRNVLADERISIRVLDAPPSSTLTIRTELSDEPQKLFFRSINEFETQESPILDLSATQPSNGYAAKDSMGIFWSMTRHGDNGHHNLMPRDVSLPLKFNISVEDSNGGHLCSDTLHRHYMAPGVERIKVSEGRIRGTLFIPPRTTSEARKHPGILNVYGGIHCGNVIEEDSAMLASRGFMTLSLGFFGVDDLPKTYQTLDSEYFDEAIDYLISREDVLSENGIGVIGISKGGDLAQSLACLRPDAVGAVCIQNGACTPVLCPLTKNGEPLGSPAELDYEGLSMREDGAVDISKIVLVPEIDSERNIPIENFPGNVLWIVGEDDKNFQSLAFAQNAEARVRRAAKHNFRLSIHPGMGHFVRLPFTPLTTHAPHPLVPKGMLVYFGGSQLEQIVGQEASWQEKIQFFMDSLL